MSTTTTKFVVRSLTTSDCLQPTVINSRNNNNRQQQQNTGNDSIFFGSDNNNNMLSPAASSDEVIVITSASSDVSEDDDMKMDIEQQQNFAGEKNHHRVIMLRDRNCWRVCCLTRQQHWFGHPIFIYMDSVFLLGQPIVVVFLQKTHLNFFCKLAMVVILFVTKKGCPTTKICWIS